MGLCKCPKKKLTNQFCYEHRVNVCQYCMVSNHPKCVVQSYVQWLQDSDYNPICVFCKQDLATDDCIRLVCFHVFHWDCLDQYARSLPPTTAPAGYTCPVCREPIIPKPNLICPVADVLRERISSVNWARLGLGLPLLSNEERTVKKEKHTNSSPNLQPSSNSDFRDEIDKTQKDVVVYMNEGNGNFSRNDYQMNLPRRLGHTTDNQEYHPQGVDDDDHKKYIRKTFMGLSWRKLIKIRQCTKYISMKLRRPLFLILFVLLMLIFFSIFGRIMSGADPSAFLHEKGRTHLSNEAIE